MKCQIQFSVGNKKNKYSNTSSAEIFTQNAKHYKVLLAQAVNLSTMISATSWKDKQIVQAYSQ